MTQGWTGRKCPSCKGTGEDKDNSGYSCPACGGTGDEYGDLDNGGLTKIEEPPQ